MHELKSGQVRVGGFTTRNPVSSGSSGGLVTLAFTVVNPGNATLMLSNMMDDVVSWTPPSARLDVASSQTPDTTSDKGTSRASEGQTIAPDASTASLPTGGSPQQPVDSGTKTQPEQPVHEESPPPADSTYRPGSRQIQTSHALSPAEKPFFPPMRRNDTQDPIAWQQPRAEKPAQHVTTNHAPMQTAMSARRYHPASTGQPPPTPTTDAQRRNADPPSASVHTMLNSLLSAAALLGVIIMLLLQRKELTSQRKALHAITRELEHVSHASEQIGRAVRRHTADALASARLNALSMLLKVELEKASFNKMLSISNGTASFDEERETAEPDRDKIADYLAALESELKKS